MLNSFMPSRLLYHTPLDWSISNRTDVWLVFTITMVCKENIGLNVKKVNPDQTPQNAASDMGIHFLPMSLLWA